MNNDKIVPSLTNELARLIDILNDTKQTIKPKVLDFNDLAKILDVSPQNVRNLDLRGELPKPLKIGKTKKWHISEFDAWLKSGAPSRVKWEHMKNNIQY